MPTTKLRMTKVLRFWIDCAYERIKHEDSQRTKALLTARLLREFEQAGDAMRYVDAHGRVAWKATPRMLTRLADAERDARDDLADVP